MEKRKEGTNKHTNERNRRWKKVEKKLKINIKMIKDWNKYLLWSRLTHAMFWFSVLDFKHSKLCWILLTKFSSSKVLVWLFIELLTVSFILMLLELKIPVFSMCSSLVKSRLLFKFELMPDNELDDKRLLIPMTPFLICWSLNWMKSRNALLAASMRASFFDFPWPTYFWPST